jgi:heme A synthase
MTGERATVQRLLRNLAGIGVALMLVVIVSSAYLRLEQAGLSCADWPDCYGRIATRAPVTSEVGAARFVHRIAASAVGVALLALLLVAATQRPLPRLQTAIAGSALLVAIGLATLGAQFSTAAPGPPLPAVTLSNLGGGFALLGLLWWLRLTTLPMPAVRRPARAGLRWLAALGLLALIAQIALGGLVNAKFAALSCPAFPTCGASLPKGALLSSLDPTQALAVGIDGMILRPPALAVLPWAHRIGALVVLALGLLLAAPLFRTGGPARRLAVLLAALLALQVALGAAAVLLAVPLPVVLAHNLIAALLLCTLVSVNRLAGAGAA